MTLGRTPSGAIKIKTDGGLRAVGCACCGGCNCSNRPTGKYKFISTNFSPIVYQDTDERCYTAYPGDPNPNIWHTVAVLENGGTMTLIWRNCDGNGWINWEVTLFNFSGPWGCANLSAFPSLSTIDPSGTHQFYGQMDPSCVGWEVTIGLNNE
jgi:hypothetical protein